MIPPLVSPTLQSRSIVETWIDTRVRRPVTFFPVHGSICPIKKKASSARFEMKKLVWSALFVIFSLIVVAPASDAQAKPAAPALAATPAAAPAQAIAPAGCEFSRP